MEMHYIYKITNLKNNKTYVGVRTHPNPKLDEYMGSGTCIQKVIEIEGVENFKKEILKSFNTREEAEDFEGKILTEEFCNSPETYNINRTGIYSDNKHCFRKDLWYDYFSEIREQYEQGISRTELAKKYKCDKGTIKNICSDILRTASKSQQLRYDKFVTSGARDLNFDKQYLSELIKLYCEEKWSVNRIASHFKKSCSFIERRLKEKNIKKRSRKENNEKPFKQRKK
jgi:hypothetical protein